MAWIRRWFGILEDATVNSIDFSIDFSILQDTFTTPLMVRIRRRFPSSLLHGMFVGFHHDQIIMRYVRGSTCGVSCNDFMVQPNGVGTAPVRIWHILDSQARLLF